MLNIGTFVATPYSGMLLASLGADVVKVEPPGGDPFRVTGFFVNGGMRSLSIDLKSPEGLALFRSLAATADITVEGLRPGLTQTLGIDYESLRLVRDDIVTVSLSAYGEGGPLSNQPGFDMVVQGMTGQMAAQGGNDEPVANTIAINDVASAVTLALTCTLATLHRRRTGEGQRCWSSIAGTSVLLQSSDLVEYAGRRVPRRGGADFQGDHHLDRYYQAGDGRWVRIQHPQAAESLSSEEIALVGVDAVQYADDPYGAVRAWLGGMSAREAIAHLENAGIAAVLARTITEVVRDPQLVGRESFHFRATADGRVYSLPGRLSSFDRTVRYGQLEPPGLGEHTVELLTELGCTPAVIADLAERGVVRCGAPMDPPGLPVAYR